MKLQTQGFSIIEVLVGIMIFSLGLVSIYMLILSSIKMNEYSKNSVIASNLARESLENIRNIRDNNYSGVYNWNKFPGSNVDAKFATGSYYTLETNPLSGGVEMKLLSDFAEGKDFLSTKMKSYQLYMTPKKSYTYDNTSPNSPTQFYRYVTFDDVKSNTGGVLEDALIVTSKVIWYKHGYHEIKLDTILTNNQRN